MTLPNLSFGTPDTLASGKHSPHLMDAKLAMQNHQKHSLFRKVIITDILNTTIFAGNYFDSPPKKGPNFNASIEKPETDVTFEVLRSYVF